MATGQMEKTNNVGYSIGAVLAGDFTFTRWDGQDITLAKGTAVQVDTCNGIAHDGNYYFSVEYTDYRVEFPN